MNPPLNHPVTIHTKGVRYCFVLALICLFFQSGGSVIARVNGEIVNGKFTLSGESLKSDDAEIWLVKNWKYHPGDNMAWADPAFDDSD
ncbi:MAG: hypothetical protein O7E52_08035 [Candidatus Poribacteria bacterium]|nr:hypothetical protein [Candidatus Poribacteria bacterium]